MLRSDFHVAIVSLSSLAWNIRKTALRLLGLSVFDSISDLIFSTILELKTRLTNHAKYSLFVFLLHLLPQPLDRLAYGLIEVTQLLPIHPLLEGGTNVNTGQPKSNVVLVVDH